jgi:HEPN domain-containing protein
MIWRLAGLPRPKAIYLRLIGCLVAKDHLIPPVSMPSRLSIEKALKAMLAFYAQPIPRSHDLDELQRLCLVVYSNSELAALDLTEATDFAVSLRDDIEFWSERSTAEKAVLLATRVLEIIRAVMGAAKPEESSEQR